MKWRHTLYAKLAGGLVLVLLFVGLLYALVATGLSNQLRLSADQQLNRHLAQNLVDDKRIVQDGAVNKPALKETFMEYMSINPSIEIYYINLQGEILSYSAEPGTVKRRAVRLEPIQEFLSGEAPFPLLGDDPRSHDRQKPFSVTPIPSAELPLGYLYVVLHGEEFANAQAAQSQRYGLTMSIFAVLASLLVGLIIGLLIFKHLSKRIKALQTRVTAFAESDFKQPDALDKHHAPKKNGDEIDELESRFAQMSQHICEQWTALSHQDQLRREMIASISHDLRTPLASVQGYLETIALKSEKLDEEEKQRYFNIAIKQTKRLQTLMDQLFELVKLEAKDTPVNFEPFCIRELVYDVANKFNIKAESKNIELTVVESDIDVEVLADIALIERVLDNLISNALHYVPEDHKVWLEVTTSDDGQINVSVNDDGTGISRQQQSLIFERFHRADNPQRTSTGHAGLGLAIVKKILDLHEQKVWVESEVGQGAKFTFTLAATG